MNAVDESGTAENEKAMNGKTKPEEPMPIASEDADLIHKEIWSKPQLGKHLTKIELFAQSFILLVAG